MRGLAGAVLLIAGLLIATASSARAEATVETVTFKTHGPEGWGYTIPTNVGDDAFEYCVDGKGIFHATTQPDGDMNVVSNFDLTESYRNVSPGCESRDGYTTTSRYHRVTRNLSLQEEHGMEVAESSSSFRCYGWEGTLHCTYTVFFHFAGGRMQFDRGTAAECTATETPPA